MSSSSTSARSWRSIVALCAVTACTALLLPATTNAQSFGRSFMNLPDVRSILNDMKVMTQPSIALPAIFPGVLPGSIPVSLPVFPVEVPVNLPADVELELPLDFSAETSGNSFASFPLIAPGRSSLDFPLPVDIPADFPFSFPGIAGVCEMHDILPASVLRMLCSHGSSSSSGAPDSSSSSSSSSSTPGGGSQSSSSSTSSVSSSSSSTSSSSSSSSSTSTTSNVILNASLETEGSTGRPAHWHMGGFGSHDAQFVYPDEAFEGDRGASIIINTYADGDAKWYFDDVPVVPGQEYVFSDHYKSTAPTQVVVRYADASNAFTYGVIGAPAAAADWQNFTGTFTPPAGTVSVTVFHLLQSAGKLTVDAFSLTQVPSQMFDQGYVTLTFDDGWTSHYTTVRPILSQAGLKGSFYIVTQEMLNADPGTINDPNTYMSSSAVLELHNAGHEVSAHTRTHTSLVSLNQSDAMHEIQGSRDDLLSIGVTPADTFVYPYGEYNGNVIQYVKDAGFVGARTVDGGYNDKSTNRYQIRTQSVVAGTTAADVKSWIDTAVANKTWLTITIHQVDNSGGPYSTTPAILQEIAQYLNQQNVAVITLDQGIDLLQ